MKKNNFKIDFDLENQNNKTNNQELDYLLKNEQEILEKEKAKEKLKELRLVNEEPEKEFKINTNSIFEEFEIKRNADLCKNKEKHIQAFISLETYNALILFKKEHQYKKFKDALEAALRLGLRLNYKKTK